MRAKKLAMTMIEILIYCFLSILALVVVYALYMLARRTQTSTTSSYIVGGNTETAITALRRDLSQTALGTIQSYPQGAGGAPGVSMISALTDVMQINPYGAPKWDRHVYYALIGTSGSKTGTLFRFEDPIPDANVNFLPSLATKVPGQEPGEKRAALHNVLMPNTAVEGLAGQPGYVADEYGGFRVSFVRREGGPSGNESVTGENPADADDASNNTGLVEVELKILQKSGFGKPDFYCIKFRVRPMY